MATLMKSCKQKKADYEERKCMCKRSGHKEGSAYIVLISQVLAVVTNGHLLLIVMTSFCN